MALNALVDSFLPQSEKCGNKRVNWQLDMDFRVKFNRNCACVIHVTESLRHWYITVSHACPPIGGRGGLGGDRFVEWMWSTHYTPFWRRGDMHSACICLLFQLYWQSLYITLRVKRHRSRGADTFQKLGVSILFLAIFHPSSPFPMGGFKGGRGPLWKVCPPVPPTARSEVNDAGMILLNYVVIAMCMCICERRFMSVVCNFTLVLLVSL